jgi:hypothetical protein
MWRWFSSFEVACFREKIEKQKNVVDSPKLVEKNEKGKGGLVFAGCLSFPEHQDDDQADCYDCSD